LGLGTTPNGDYPKMVKEVLEVQKEQFEISPERLVDVKKIIEFLSEPDWEDKYELEEFEKLTSDQMMEQDNAQIARREEAFVLLGKYINQLWT
jgi:hypothetical protein